MSHPESNPVFGDYSYLHGCPRVSLIGGKEYHGNRTGWRGLGSGEVFRGQEWWQAPICLKREQEVAWIEETTTPLMTAVRAATSAA